MIYLQMGRDDISSFSCNTTGQFFSSSGLTLLGSVICLSSGIVISGGNSVGGRTRFDFYPLPVMLPATFAASAKMSSKTNV